MNSRVANIGELTRVGNLLYKKVLTRGGEIFLKATDLADMPDDYSSGSILVGGSSSFEAVAPSSLGILEPEELVGSKVGEINHIYATNNISRITITLPITATFGSMIGITGKGAGGWKIAQNEGQTIHSGHFATVTGTTGYVESLYFKDSVMLMCITEDSDWSIIWSSGALNINIS